MDKVFLFKFLVNFEIFKVENNREFLVSAEESKSEESTGTIELIGNYFGSEFFNAVFGQFMNVEGLALIGVMLVLWILSATGGKKGKISSGRMATNADKMAAVSRALKQMKSAKRSSNALYSGTPNYWLGKGGAWMQTLLGKPPSFFMPDANRGILIIGSPGSGKTFSVIDPIIESAFQQGFPVVIYDKKGDQMKLHAPLALRYGYQVEIMAPGESFSGVINPLDYMKDPTDAAMAAEIAKVIVDNSKDAGTKGSDEFFTKSGAMLTQALLQLVKSTKYPDLAMVYALVTLPDFVSRVAYACDREDSKRMDPWIAASFKQLLGMKDAEKTVAGVLANAQSVFMSLIQRDILPCLIGKSTIDTFIEGKKLIVFKLDDSRRGAIGPLLAAMIHLCVVSNLGPGTRKDPLVVSLDEFPSLKFNNMANWANEFRSAGGIFVLGIQSLQQLYDKYGKDNGQAIANALSTHVLFNPGDGDTAKKYSDRYGDTELIVKNRSRGRNMGKEFSRNVNYSESLQKKPLISVDEILRMGQGMCIVTSPAYGSGNEALYPVKGKVFVPKSDIKRRTESEQLWDEVRVKYERRARTYFTDSHTGEYLDLNQQLQMRIAHAEEILPMPDETPMTVEESDDDKEYSEDERMAAVDATLEALDAI